MYIFSGLAWRELPRYLVATCNCSSDIIRASFLPKLFCMQTAHPQHCSFPNYSTIIYPDNQHASCVALTSFLLQSYCTYVLFLATSDDYSNRLHTHVDKLQFITECSRVRQGQLETRFPFPIFSPAPPRPFVCVMSSSFICSVCPLDLWTHAHTLVNNS